MTDGGHRPALTISVVIPCYNYEAFLGAAIESVIAGTRTPDEIIVVDDGSQDGSAAVARRFPDVTLIQKSNGGMASALNAGAAAATGDVLVLLDADDLVDQGRLEWIETAFRDRDVSMAWHPLRIVTVDGDNRGEIPHVPLPEGDLVPGILVNGLPTFAVTSGIAVRRSAFDDVGPIPEDRFRAAAEGYVVRTVPFAGRVAAAHRPLGTYRSHAGSDSRALADVDEQSIATKLRVHVERADHEHQLLSTSAGRAGYELTVPRLRGLDPVYLELARLDARLTTGSRRAAWRAMMARRVELPPRLAYRRVWGFVAVTWYVAMPKRVSAIAYAIRGDHELRGWLRHLARVYWRLRSLRLMLAGHVARMAR